MPQSPKKVSQSADPSAPVRFLFMRSLSDTVRFAAASKNRAEFDSGRSARLGPPAGQEGHGLRDRGRAPTDRLEEPGTRPWISKLHFVDARDVTKGSDHRLRKQSVAVRLRPAGHAVEAAAG